MHFPAVGVPLTGRRTRRPHRQHSPAGARIAARVHRPSTCPAPSAWSTCCALASERRRGENQQLLRPRGRQLRVRHQRAQARRTSHAALPVGRHPIVGIHDQQPGHARQPERGLHRGHCHTPPSSSTEPACPVPAPPAYTVSPGTPVDLAAPYSTCSPHRTTNRTGQQTVDRHHGRGNRQRRRCAPGHLRHQPPQADSVLVLDQAGSEPVVIIDDGGGRGTARATSRPVPGKRSYVRRGAPPCFGPGRLDGLRLPDEEIQRLHPMLRSL